jgi:hypothetical protein
MQPDTTSYLLLFCALLLARDRRASLEQALKLVPLSGGAKALAGELTTKSLD